MPYQLTLPPELAPAAPELGRDRRFRRMLRLGRVWRRPAVVLWAARWLGYTWGDDPVVTLAAIRSGFAGWDRPWRLVKALAVLLWACLPQRRRGLIYQDRDLLVFTDNAPRRWGPPQSVLRPSFGASPIGPPPVADVPEAPPAPAPARLPRPGVMQRMAYTAVRCAPVLKAR